MSTGQLNVISVNSINLVKKTLTLVGNGSGCDLFVINVTSPTAAFILSSSQMFPDRRKAAKNCFLKNFKFFCELRPGFPGEV